MRTDGRRSTFNPGFLGGNFLWWVNQIADDSTWRENISAGKIKSKNDTPGWGYRYKVRIIGIHDQGESSIKSDQLPWAQVMYPITAGGGQGGSFQTPALKQGNFVFGFFLDSQDRQVPVIMGVLGNNATTRLKTKTGLGGSQEIDQSLRSIKIQRDLAGIIFQYKIWCQILSKSIKKMAEGAGN